MKHLFNTLKILLIVGLTLSTTASGQSRLTGTVGQPNEERLIRVEEGVKNLEKRLDAVEASLNKRMDDLRTDMNGRFSDLNGRLDELRATVLTGFGVLFAGMFALVGFVIWDRRTALAPVAKQTRDLYANQEKILAALREHAKHDEKLMEFMKHEGLL